MLAGANATRKKALPDALEEQYARPREGDHDNNLETITP